MQQVERIEQCDLAVVLFLLDNALKDVLLVVGKLLLNFVGTEVLKQLRVVLPSRLLVIDRINFDTGLTVEVLEARQDLYLIHCPTDVVHQSPNGKFLQSEKLLPCRPILAA